jgi:hypothetical protein
MRPRSSFAGAAIEVSDLGRSIAFHRLWLPMLGFRRVWASPDRVMWSRGYDHFVMRQAKDGVSYGPGALWLAVSAESRAQVDQIYAELRDAKAEILQPPKELDYFALRATIRWASAIPTACRSRSCIAGTSCLTWPTPSRSPCPATASPSAAICSSRRPARRPIRP